MSHFPKIQTSEPVDDPNGGYATRASIFDKLNSPEPDRREMGWKEFFARYSPIIVRFARRCGASQQDIDDIVADVMANFFAASGGFEYDPAIGRFRGWLKTCTVRAAVRRAGKNLRFRGATLDELPDVEIAIEPVWEDVWEKELVARALYLLRQQAGDGVPFRAFEQYVLLDRPALEVAAELGTSVDNVHQAKSRMTKQLREMVSRLRKADE